MKLYAAISTGLLVAAGTVALLWCATLLQIQDILFWAVLAYWIAICAFLFVTDAIDAAPKGRRRHRARKRKPPIVTINKDAWERGRK